MVDDPADKSGTVEAGTGGTAAPHIGHPQVLFCLTNHIGKFLIRQGFAGNVIIRVRAGRVGVDIILKQIRAVTLGLQQEFIPFLLIFRQARGCDCRSQPVVFEGDIEDVIVVLHFDLVFFLGRIPGFRVGHSAGVGFCAGSRLHFFLQCQRVLPFKQRTQRILNFRSGVILEQHCQIGGQLVWIVVDLIQLVPVFIVARMGGFHIGNLLLKGCLQRLIIRIGPCDVLIRCGEGGAQDGAGAALQHGRAGRKRPHNHHDQQDKHQDDNHRVGMLDGKVFDLFQQCFGPLRRLFGAFGRAARRLGTGGCALGSFGGIVLLFDFLPLLPARDGVGSNLRVVGHRLLVQCFHIGLVCLPVKPGGFSMGF